MVHGCEDYFGSACKSNVELSLFSESLQLVITCCWLVGKLRYVYLWPGQKVDLKGGLVEAYWH